MSGSAAISPTAHYTGYVWSRAGLSHSSLTTTEGRVLFEAMRPMMTASQLLGGASLESYLLTRHQAIDVLLERAIEEERVGQVVELAAGLSPRGWRFTQRYPDLVYVETDLVGMVERKRRALADMQSLSERHRVLELDVLSDQSLDAALAKLDSAQGLALVTEGLLGYLAREEVEGLWRRLARGLAGFAHGLYVSDLHIGGVQTTQVRAFRVLLSAFVRSRVHLHFDTPGQARDALLDAGFGDAEIHRAAALAPETVGPGSALAHTLEAWV
jgi:O-methyltransferase involved in polyketide biosynthesis